MTNATQSRPTVVLIGGRAAHEFTVLRDLGCRIIYLEKQVPLTCIPLVDVPVDVDLDDWPAVEAAVRRVCGDRAPDAVLTHVEPRLPLMAHLRERLGLRASGLSPQTASNCRDKFNTRVRLFDAEVPSPRFGLAESIEEADEIAAEIGFPVVVKPRDGAGGLGVRWCGSRADVRAAAAAILDLDTRLLALPGVLVETYVAGPEFAVQTVTQAGRTEIVSILAQRTTEPPVFVELAYEHPADIPPEWRTEIAEVTRMALDALGVNNWITHTQLRRGPDGFKVIEVNARRPGGRLVEMTAAVSGVDLVRAASELALGRTVTVDAPRAACAAYRSVVFDQTGLLLYNPRIEVAGHTVAPIVELDIPSGDPVLPVDHPDGGVYGRIVTFGDTSAAANDRLAGIERALDLQVLPLAGVDHTADVREFKPCC